MAAVMPIVATASAEELVRLATSHAWDIFCRRSPAYEAPIPAHNRRKSLKRSGARMDGAFIKPLSAGG
jgi:hypothetical protein